MFLIRKWMSLIRKVGIIGLNLAFKNKVLVYLILRNSGLGNTKLGNAWIFLQISCINPDRNSITDSGLGLFLNLQHHAWSDHECVFVQFVGVVTNVFTSYWGILGNLKLGNAWIFLKRINPGRKTLSGVGQGYYRIYRTMVRPWVYPCTIL